MTLPEIIEAMKKRVVQVSPAGRSPSHNERVEAEALAPWIAKLEAAEPLVEVREVLVEVPVPAEEVTEEP